MSKKILIGTGLTTQVYAPVTGALTTADAATDPGLLATGAIGIYGMPEVTTGVAALNLESLITISENTTATGKVEYSDFDDSSANRMIRISQGGEYPVSTGVFDRYGVTKITKQAYVAPIKEVTFIGYNGTNGSLTLPTIVANDYAGIGAIQKEGTTPDQIREQENYSTGALLASTAAYDILRPIANQVNNTPVLSKTHTAGITSNGTQADFTGTATALKFTKGSTTVAFMIQDATSGWVASTGTVAAADVIGVSHANMKSVTFTADIAGTGAGRHVITIGGTIYNVADAGSAAQNATAIAAAINAGTQATATVSTADVTIVLNSSTYGAKILVVQTDDDSSWVVPTLTVNTTTGETVATIYKASAAVSAAASFELDVAYVGETGYYLGGTSKTLEAGIVTSITEYGLKMTADTAGASYDYAKQGVLENATVTSSVSSSKGLGSGVEMVKIEQGLVAYRGQFDTYSKWAKQLPLYASASTNYDVYTLQLTQGTVTTGAPHNKTANSVLMVAFPTGQTASTSFSTIIKALCPNASCNF